jgi:AraC-like DNA-binding protein
MGPAERVQAWQPAVAGVREVFHARFVDHAYPMHTHDAWTLLVIDEGLVRYDLDRHAHAAPTEAVTLLPPGVAHDGRAATVGGFRKRVIYLDTEVIDSRWVGQAVDRPTYDDQPLRTAVGLLDGSLRRPGDELEAESRLALVSERLRRHLARQDPRPAPGPSRSVARLVRERLDADIDAQVRLSTLAAHAGVTTTHAVRAFTREYGLPPHRYLVGRRVDAARRMLLAGASGAETAAALGFYDQAHLTRHFRRLTGVSPARFARSGG